MCVINVTGSFSVGKSDLVVERTRYEMQKNIQSRRRQDQVAVYKQISSGETKILKLPETKVEKGEFY